MYLEYVYFVSVVFHFHHQLSSNLVVSSTEHAEQRVGVSHRPDIWVRYGFIGGKFGLSQAFRPRISSPKVNKGPLISHCIAIVWSWKYRDTFSIVIHFIACFFDFVATNNIVQLIIFQETIGHILKKNNIITVNIYKRIKGNNFVTLYPGIYTSNQSNFLTFPACF